MISLLPKHTYRLALLLIGVAFLYCLVKAYQLSITGDEASSYLDVCFMNIGYFFGGISNTHLINTVWIKAVSIFSSQPIALRLLSVFSIWIFGISLYLFCISAGRKHLAIPILLACFLNPYFIDFFCLARGYALGFGLMMISLYALSQYLNTDKIQYRHVASLAALVAAFGAFTMLNFYLLVLVWIFLDEFRKNSFRGILKLYWFWLFHLLGILFIAFILLQYQGLEAAFPEPHFFPDAWFSIVKSSSSFSSFITLLLCWLSLLILAGALVFHFLDFRFFSISGILVLLVLGIFALHVLQHYLIGAAYPSMRSLVYYYPLVVLVIAFVKFKDSNVQAIAFGLGVAVLLGMSVNMIRSASFTSSKEADWAYDLKEALEDLEKETGGKLIRLGVSGNYYNQVNYYVLVNRKPWSNVGHGFQVEKKAGTFYSLAYTTGDYDYFILEEGDVEIAGKKWKLKELKYYPLTKIRLFKRDN